MEVGLQIYGIVLILTPRVISGGVKRGGGYYLTTSWRYDSSALGKLR